MMPASVQSGHGPKTFAMLKAHVYKGYCSMEFDSPGDPYAGTQDLIATTLKFLA